MHHYEKTFSMLGRYAVLLAPLLMLMIGCVQADVVIINDGQSQAEIVLTEKPLPTTALAAQELQTYLEKISGAKTPIVSQPNANVPVHIFVGKSSQTDAMQITDDGLKYGAFRIIARENQIVLIGHDSSFTPTEPFLKGFYDRDRLLKDWDKLTGEHWGFPKENLYKEYNPELKIWQNDDRGTLNAVYEFLRMQGVRWYMPGELGEILPKKSTITLAEMNKTIRPDFAFRELHQYLRMFGHEGATRDEILCQLRLGLNKAPDLIGDFDLSMAHGINHVHNRDEVKAAHLEYYALYNGKRDTTFNDEGHPCLSSPGLFEQNVKFVRAVFDLLDAPMVSIMPQDGYVNLCQCDLCKGKDTLSRGWSGQISDYVWDYVNRVAIEVNKTHPDRKVSCLAYGGYLLPPTKIKQLSPNLLVGIAQHRYLFGDPAERKRMLDLRKAWLELMPQGSKQIYLYEYYLHTSPRNYPFMPIYFQHEIAEDLRSLKGISMGEFVEVYRPKFGMETLAIDHLNMYLTAQLWWNADQDVDAILSEYYANFYGPAQREMKTFIEYCEANIAGMSKNPEVLGNILQLIDKAAKKVEPDSIYGKRIAFIANYIKPLDKLREQLSVGRKNVPTAIAIDKGKAQITLDGKLDEPFWQHLRNYNFKELQTGKEPNMATSLRIGWAEDALYFGIRCAEEDMKNLNIGTSKNKDPNIWNGDCIEIELETQTHSYYQIAISPTGALMDLDRKKSLNTLWNSGAQIAAFQGENYWSLEIRIPVAGEQQEIIDSLNGVSGRKPNEAFPWFMNVCRQRVRKNETERSAFSPTGSDAFHEVLKFGKLEVR